MHSDVIVNINLQKNIAYKFSRLAKNLNYKIRIEKNKFL